jgi:aryl-alcohol dehydrogenase-like predicted oxidoreductase
MSERPPELRGAATPEGTARYRAELDVAAHPDHFRTVDGLTLSSIGIGTHRGRLDAAEDARICEAIVTSVRRGLNLVDTSSNYRDGRSERCVGAAARRLVDEGTIAGRDALILATKGGYLPLNPGTEPARARAYLEHVGCGSTLSQVVDGCHSIHPDFIAAELELSRARLGVETIDIYYLHNPEVQLRECSPAEFEDRLSACFAMLEARCRDGDIRCYGLATWHGLRVAPDDPLHLGLERLEALARAAAGGGEDHLRFVQCPFNVLMPELLLPLQSWRGEQASVLEVAAALGIGVVTSAAIGQGQALGPILDRLFGARAEEGTDAQRALQFARFAPGLASALVGMKQPEHVDEITELVKWPVLRPEQVLGDEA